MNIGSLYSGIDISEMKIIRIGFGTPFLVPKDLTIEEEKYLIASQLTIAFGNKSVDNILKKDLADFEKTKTLNESNEKEKLLDGALELSKVQQKELNRILTELNTLPDTTASIACLTAFSRLQATFCSVHSLISLGYYFESFALIRLVLEQLAYVYTASMVEDGKGSFQSPTKSISQLAKFHTQAGKLYGILSKKTHIDKSEVHKYIKIEDGKVYTLHNSIEFSLGASIYLLAVLDIQYCVFEFCFRQQLKDFKCITPNEITCEIMDNRSTKILEEYSRKIEISLKET
ncbi:hypothetical protein I2I11_10620 [Pontibacter sp. 172403-2]|uniref:hypothetical protein n=1 Tax=Pontibacter rufus TaxID=2791028 RepID=UPI0018B00AB9|nr:hypothetical protein [Pontibacter sp. 172403-2]MBF9253747.1 hypothetical protein [Pontibacter sp. 172403-2]